MNNFLDLDYQKERFLSAVKVLSGRDQEIALEALEVAEKAHRGQERDVGIPYIIHPIRASLILLEEVNIRDVDLVCALLLHDVLEDTDLGSDEIEEREVLRLVRGVTRGRSEDESKEKKLRSKQEKVSHLSEQDESIRIVKLCDRLDNRRAQEFISPENPSYQKIERWNKEYEKYIPIAKSTNQKLYNLFLEYNE